LSPLPNDVTDEITPTGIMLYSALGNQLKFDKYGLVDTDALMVITQKTRGNISVYMTYLRKGGFIEHEPDVRSSYKLIKHYAKLRLDAAEVLINGEAYRNGDVIDLVAFFGDTPIEIKTVKASQLPKKPKTAKSTQTDVVPPAPTDTVEPPVESTEPPAPVEPPAEQAPVEEPPETVVEMAVVVVESPTASIDRRIAELSEALATNAQMALDTKQAIANQILTRELAINQLLTEIEDLQREDIAVDLNALETSDRITEKILVLKRAAEIIMS